MAESPESSIDSLLRALTVVPEVRWYHLGDPASPSLDLLAAHFGIHPLQVEDCRHRHQTARVEEHDRYTFVVIRALVSPPASSAVVASAEKLSKQEAPGVDDQDDRGIALATATGVRARFEDFDIFLGPGYILTVDEGQCSLIPSISRRVAADQSLNTPDRVAHALIDAVVDQYLPALDHVGDYINHLEDRVLRRPSPATLREIFRVKRTLLDFRRVLTAMREAVNALIRRYDSAAHSTYPQDRELRLYYRDVYDHVVRALDFVETYRDLLTGSLDIYLSAVANRTNDVMKILTIWGTIALPFLIITGIYGMNVDLPFQQNRYVLLIIGAAISGPALGIFLFFRRKHWF
jgi:magnesium transporter